MDVDRIAPCGSCAWRGTDAVRGAVQDENAYAMAGVAGHAGLFSTARDVHTLVAEWVLAHAGSGRLLDPQVVRRLWRRSPSVPGTTWALGWDTPSRPISTAGTHVSADAVGHLGFTGTSIWIDIQRGVHVILLSNRVHPDRASTGIRELRPRLHDAVFEAVGRGGARRA